MPLPEEWDIRRLKGSRADFLGVAQEGSITFKPNVARVKEVNSDLIVTEKAIPVPLQPDGTFYVDLPVSVGDPDITPNFQYEVTEKLRDTADYKYTIEVSAALPVEGEPGYPFDIADLMPVGTAPSGSTALTREMADLLYAPIGSTGGGGGGTGDVTTEQLNTALASNSEGDRNRANHTGTQSPSTIEDLVEFIQDTVGAMFSGGNVTTTYNDEAGTIAINFSESGVSDPEAIRDIIGAAIIGVGHINVTVNDEADTITISTTATQNSTDSQLRDRSTHTGEQPISSIANLSTELGRRKVTFLYDGSGTWPDRSDVPKGWAEFSSLEHETNTVPNPPILGGEVWERQPPVSQP